MSNHLPHMTANNYPPYNIVKTGSLSYDIEVALAGYGKKDVSVNYEDNILKIESVKDKEEKEKDGVIHKGIAKRSFNLGWKIDSKFDLSKATADFKNGLLQVIIPFAKGSEPKTLKIN